MTQVNMAKESKSVCEKFTDLVKDLCKRECEEIVETALDAALKGESIPGAVVSKLEAELAKDIREELIESSCCGKKEKSL
jgi:hypothetical protein